MKSPGDTGPSRRLSIPASHRLPAIILALAGCLDAASHRYRLHPQPDITIHSIAADSSGELWLAASNGLYRFDGFRFYRAPEYTWPQARFVVVTDDGAVWAGGPLGLGRIQNGVFHTVTRDLLRGLAADGNEVVFEAKGLWRVGAGGRPALTFSGAVGRGFVWDPPSRTAYYICGAAFTVCRSGDAAGIQVPMLSDKAARDAQGRLWLSHERTAALYERNRLSVTHTRQPPRDDAWRGASMLTPGRNGQLWIGADTVRGVTPPIALEQAAWDAEFPPTAVHEDARGRVWVARQGLGLVEWIPDARWQRWFARDFGGDAVTMVVRSAGGEILAATHGGLFRLDAAKDVWTRLPGDARRYYSILPLPEGGFLAATGDLGVVRLDNRGRVVEVVPNPFRAPNWSWFREIARDTAGRVWAGSKAGLFRVTGAPGALRLQREELPMDNALAEVQAVDIEDAGGRVCAGYSQGIACVEPDGTWRRLRADGPVAPVRSFVMAGDSAWVARRKDGPFFRLHRSGATTPMRVEDGYGPNDTHFLKRDSRGWIWRGSSEGVHVSAGRRFGPGDWLHIHSGNGLSIRSADIYGFFEDSDGSVWLAGAEGVTHVRPDVSWFRAPDAVPRVSRLQTLGTLVRVELASMEAPAFLSRPFRYRLRPGSDPWRDSNGATINLPRPAGGPHTLEIAHAGEGDAAVLRLELPALPAATNLRWPWAAAGAPVALGGIFLWARRTETYQRARYRIAKALYTRRRRRQGAPGDDDEPVPDGRYRIVRRVSRGGFSVVYEGVDPADGTRVAVKMLRADAARPGWVRERFLAEITALQALGHPGVVGVRDWWITHNGAPCLAMPFLDGPTLRGALSEGPLERRSAARVVAQLGSALAAIHARGIVHRDVKPENVILTTAADGAGQAVLIDFGTAGLRAAEHGMALTSVVAGSPHYMAPELLTGHYSPATDIYSLAAVILEMLSGRRLADLREHASSAVFGDEIAAALQDRSSPEQAAALAALLGAALQTDPGERPAGRAAWVQSIVQILE